MGVAIATACSLLGCGGPSLTPEAPARSAAAPAPSVSMGAARAEPSGTLATSASSTSPPSSEKKGPCSVRVSAHSFAEVPNSALLDAALPGARAASADPSMREIPVPKGSVWSDCHGHPSNLGPTAARENWEPWVPMRLALDDSHGYAWMSLTSGVAVLARFRIDGDTLTATATEPEMDIPIENLRSGRIGDFELVFAVCDRSVMELDVHPSGEVSAEAWRAYVSRGDEDFSGYGMIFTRYTDSKWSMFAHDDWKFSSDGVAVRETWIPPGGRDPIDMTRRYTMHGHDLGPVSTAVPR